MVRAVEMRTRTTRVRVSDWMMRRRGEGGIGASGSGSKSSSTSAPALEKGLENKEGEEGESRSMICAGVNRIDGKRRTSPMKIRMAYAMYGS